MPEQPFDPNIPPRIGRYEVLSRLGRGGMATVYLGRGDNGRRVAIKLIRPDLAADESFRRRFEREASYARRVRQAYIAPVLDFGDHEGRPFLVTEYIEGPTVAKAVRESDPMPAHEVEQLGEQVASALAEIHAVGLVHRDLKPSNVILGRTGPRVIDFGIARALDDSGGLTAQNVRLGTPSYMAPEQFEEHTEVGKPADVFAWGGLMVFASTGRPPFGTAGNPEEVAVLSVRIRKYDPRGLDVLEEPLRTLVREAMAKDPDRRPTARDLVRRLRGDQLTPAGAASTTKEPANTHSEPAATAPVGASAFSTPAQPRPPDPPATTRFWTDSSRQPAGVPADSPGAVLPAWTALLVRVGIAVGAILLLLLGWLLLPEAARLLVGAAVGGTVVLGAISVGIWRSPSYRPALLLWPLGGLALFVGLWWFTYHQLHSQIWVGFASDRVAVLQGAGPHGVLGAANVAQVEPFRTIRQELPPLLAGALEDGIRVGDRAQGRQLALCLPLVFTPTADTRMAAAHESCRDSIVDAPLRVPTPHHPIPGTTEHTPAVAATDDQVLVAWTDGNNRRIQAGRSLNGTDIEPLGPLGEEFESDQEPALATDGDRLFLAWRDHTGHLP
jgi:predicted Ser/Thr protein kinase